MTAQRRLRARFVGGYELHRNWYWRSSRQGERGPILAEQARIRSADAKRSLTRRDAVRLALRANRDPNLPCSPMPK